jgi:holo-[acyl-carrier protein] synthase
MGLRVGLDLVELSDVEESIRIHSARYLERVYSRREIADCARPGGEIDARKLAARFAAKEATLKVLGVRDEALPWSAVEVLSDDAGALSLGLSDAAASLARERELSELAVGIAYAGDHAGAIVTARDGSSR